MLFCIKTPASQAVRVKSWQTHACRPLTLSDDSTCCYMWVVIRDDSACRICYWATSQLLAITPKISALVLTKCWCISFITSMSAAFLVQLRSHHVSPQHTTVLNPNLNPNLYIESAVLMKGSLLMLHSSCSTHSVKRQKCNNLTSSNMSVQQTTQSWRCCHQWHLPYMDASTST